MISHSSNNNETVFNHKSKVIAACRKLLTSWDRQTLPFQPPRPCLLYHLIEMPELQSPRALTTLTSLYFQNNNNQQQTRRLNVTKKLSEVSKKVDVRKNQKLPKRRKRNGDNESTSSSSSSSSSSTTTSRSSSSDNSSLNNRNQINNNPVNGEPNNANNNLATSSSGYHIHHQLLDQQQRMPMYFPLMRTCVPDSEGRYWNLDPNKIYYVEEFGETTGTTAIALPEILPVLPRYDILQSTTERLKYEGQRTKNNNNDDDDTVSTGSAESDGSSLSSDDEIENNKKGETNPRKNPVRDFGVQADVWIEGKTGKRSSLITKSSFAMTSQPKLVKAHPNEILKVGDHPEFTAQQSCHHRSNNRNSNFFGNEDAEEERTNNSSTIMAKQQNLNTKKNNTNKENPTLTSISAINHKSRSMIFSHNFLQVLLDPTSAGGDNANHVNPEKQQELSLALSQGISFLRQHVGLMNNHINNNSNNNNNANNNLSFTQIVGNAYGGNNNNSMMMMNPISASQNLGNSSALSQQASLTVFLSQSQHSGIKTEKDEVVKRAVRDGLRFLPLTVQMEVRKVLESVDESWKVK